MYTLSIEHAISDFETWQAAFERDPVGRQRLGVLRYRVFQPQSDPHYVIIELDFGNVGAAEAFVVSLEGVWQKPELSPGLARQPNAVRRPQTRIFREMAAHTY